MFKDDKGNQLPAKNSPGIVLTDSAWFDGDKRLAEPALTPTAQTHTISMNLVEQKSERVVPMQPEKPEKPAVSDPKPATEPTGTSPTLEITPIAPAQPVKKSVVAKPADRPGTPKFVFTKKNRDKSIYVGWTATKGKLETVRYTIHRNGKLIASVAGKTSFVDRKVPSGVKQTYTVRAVSKNGTLSLVSKESVVNP
jgi:hypothetical protein